MIDGTTLTEARQRDGEAAEDRPEEVDRVVTPKERVGYEHELPLLDREYSEYPGGQELLQPDAEGILRNLKEHPRVTSTEDCADELGTTVEMVEKAAELHGIDLPEGGGFDVSIDRSRIDTLLGDEWPEDMRSSDNQITVSALYLKGLSLFEIATVLEDDGERNVREEELKQILIDAGLLEGLSSDEREFQRRQNRGEINQPRYEGGITIDATDL
ncbi:hypothetical protein [Halomicrobium urmianum]|uniref:hypothetical protein n=1 Tax=Halomicrobium urmianum TaxID=1586233 RepID=UPI001CD953DE|nr:hypothetical protein [Halomicrobium urmianum]